MFRIHADQAAAERLQVDLGEESKKIRSKGLAGKEVGSGRGVFYLVRLTKCETEITILNKQNLKNRAVYFED